MLTFDAGGSGLGQSLVLEAHNGAGLDCAPSAEQNIQNVVQLPAANFAGLPADRTGHPLADGRCFNVRSIASHKPVQNFTRSQCAGFRE